MQFTLEGAVETVRTAKGLDALLTQQKYVVIFGYQKELESALKNKIRRINQAITNLSQRDEYKIARVSFAKVLADEAVWRRITNNNMDQQMVIALFAEGQLLQKNNTFACLFGDQGSANIASFIDNFIGDEIQDAVKHERDERERRAREHEEDDSSSSVNVYYTVPYYSPYNYWGSPWYGGGYYGGYYRGYRRHRGGSYRGGHGGHRGGRHR